MSQPPYGYPPQYPGQGYPQQPPVPSQLYPHIPYVPQPYAHGQPPAAMSYPGVAPLPTAPVAPGFLPTVAPTPVYPSYGQIVEWVPTTCDGADTLVNRAVVAGYEGHDGSPLWVIRAHYKGDLIPGKLAIKHKSAYVPWGGQENKVNQFEVCCAPPDKVKWIESRNGEVPPNAVPGGRTSTNEPLYIGRAKEQRSLTPGKIHPSHKNLYISFGGNELPHSVYEVLCTV